MESNNTLLWHIHCWVWMVPGPMGTTGWQHPGYNHRCSIPTDFSSGIMSFNAPNKGVMLGDTKNSISVDTPLLFAPCFQEGRLWACVSDGREDAVDDSEE